MQIRRPATDAETRGKALGLLRAGRVSLPELAHVLGVSTQTVWNWCREEGLNWRKARLGVVTQEWRRVLKERAVRPSKRQLHDKASKATADFVARGGAIQRIEGKRGNGAP